MANKTRYKFLNKQGKLIKSNSGNLAWKIGEWNKVDENNISLCNYGLQCSKKIYEAFSYVPSDILAVVEVRGKHEDSDDKEVWSEMRIVEAYKWTKKDSVALSIFTAELCIKEYEKLYPNDTAPRDAIEVAKAVLSHDTAKTRSAESAARSAESAARSAAWSAAKKRTINKIEKWFVNHLQEMEKIK